MAIPRTPIEIGKYYPSARASARGFADSQADIEGFLSQRIPAIGVQIPTGAKRVQVHVGPEGGVLMFDSAGRPTSNGVVSVWAQGALPKNSIVEMYLSDTSGTISDVLYSGKDARDLPYVERLALIPFQGEGQIHITSDRLQNLKQPLFAEGVDRVLIKQASLAYPKDREDLNALLVSKPSEDDLELDSVQQIIAKCYGVDTERSDETIEVKILKADVDKEKRLVYGVVIRPNRVDNHLDIMDSEEVEKSAHFFMAVNGIMGLVHENKAPAVPVESYIAPCDFTLGDGEVKKGDWVLVSFVMDDELWAKIKAKELNAYSPGGVGLKQRIEI